METIGATLKSIREKNEFLLQEVTEQTGIDKTLLSRIENGKRLPTKEQVKLLCNFYEASENEMIIQWLSDKIVYELQDEEFALTAVQVAEEIIKYLKSK